MGANRRRPGNQKKKSPFFISMFSEEEKIKRTILQSFRAIGRKWEQIDGDQGTQKKKSPFFISAFSKHLSFQSRLFGLEFWNSAAW